MKESSHRRFNILNGEWILVSPHRSKRPWQGKVEKISREPKLQYDPSCYLCPGNIRANGEKILIINPLSLLIMILVLFRKMSLITH